MLTSEDMKRITSQGDLVRLIEHYKKEIWEWKQKESKWLSDKNLLEGSKKTIDELATKLVEISKINLGLKNNRPLNTMDEIAYRELEAENKKLKKRAQEAEGENTIIKGIGSASPEMKALQKELAQEKADRQYDKVVHAKELEKALQK